MRIRFIPTPVLISTKQRGLDPSGNAYAVRLAFRAYFTISEFVVNLIEMDSHGYIIRMPNPKLKQRECNNVLALSKSRVEVKINNHNSTTPKYMFETVVHMCNLRKVRHLISSEVKRWYIINVVT